MEKGKLHAYHVVSPGTQAAKKLVAGKLELLDLASQDKPKD